MVVHYIHLRSPGYRVDNILIFELINISVNVKEPYELDTGKFRPEQRSKRSLNPVSGMIE